MRSRCYYQYHDAKNAKGTQTSCADMLAALPNKNLSRASLICPSAMLHSCEQKNAQAKEHRKHEAYDGIRF
jgi:hypothetical protein